MIPNKTGAEVNDPRPVNLTSFAVYGEICLATGSAVSGIPTSPTVGSGEGAPTHVRPNGSLFLRTDGSADSTTYKRVSGVWEPINAGGGGALEYTFDSAHDFLTGGATFEGWAAGGDYADFDVFDFSGGLFQVALNNSSGVTKTATLTMDLSSLYYGLHLTPHIRARWVLDSISMTAAPIGYWDGDLFGVALGEYGSVGYILGWLTRSNGAAANAISYRQDDVYPGGTSYKITHLVPATSGDVIVTDSACIGVLVVGVPILRYYVNNSIPRATESDMAVTFVISVLNGHSLSVDVRDLAVTGLVSK